MKRGAIQEIPCSTAEELWDRLSPTHTLFDPPFRLIYRGQCDSKWKLIPSVLRKKNRKLLQEWFGLPVKADEQVYIEVVLLERFAEFCDQAGIRIPNDSIEFRENVLTRNKQDRFTLQPENWPRSEILEVMAVAQHHGVPTRLLDWTRNPYAAVYFAASSAVSAFGKWSEDQRLTIWVLNTEWKNLYRRVRIIQIPGAMSPHIAAQEGLFTVHPYGGSRGEPFEVVGLEDEYRTLSKCPLLKLTVPVKESARLLELGDMIGITAATMFPSADGAGRAVMDRVNSWVARRCKGS